MAINDKEVGKKVGYKSPPKDTRFKKWVKVTPSWEVMKAGWDRKREAKRIMDEMIKYQEMTLEEFQEHLKENKDKLQIKNLITAGYLKDIVSGKERKDWINRHISYAPQQITGDDWPIEIDIQSASIDDLLKIIKQK